MVGQAQGKNFHFKKENGNVERRDGNKAKLKPSKPSIKSCCFKFFMKQWRNVSSEGLGKSYPMALMVAAHMVSFLGWLCLLPADFLGRE